MAAEHYPETPTIGDVIRGLAATQPTDTKVFHAGTTVGADGTIVTSGGRVLCVCALGSSVAGAQLSAYAAMAAITWDGEFHRHDIGWRAIKREQP
jgi:phosphoribosylamine--glycine ligase